MNGNLNQTPPPTPTGDSNPDVPRASVPGGVPTPPASPPQKPTRPYITYTLLGLSVLVYILQIGSTSLLGADLPARYGLKVNELIVAGELWRLITPVLLHGSVLHIGFNMYALYLFGPGLEANFGRWRFLALYLLAGFAGNVFSMMFTASNSLGSSTAIFGLLGAHGVFVYQNRSLLGEKRARASLGQIIRIAVINLLIGLSPGIDNWGHIGGLLGGALFTWFGGPLLAVDGVYPAIAITDKRDSSQVLQAIAIVGGFFGFIAAGALYIMSR